MNPPLTQQEFEDAVIDIITAIYNSTVIPDSHKEKYVEHIEANGVTEKMIEELEKVFTEEAKSLDMTLQEKQDLLEDLNELIEEESEAIDQQQAEILAAVDDFAEKKPQEVREELGAIEDDFQAAIEGLSEESKEEQIAAIKSKIQKQ